MYKRVCSFACSHAEKTALSYDVRTSVKHACKEMMFMPVHFCGKVLKFAYTEQLHGRFVHVHSCAGGLNTPYGAMLKKDMLQYRQDDEELFGFAASRQTAYL